MSNDGKILFLDLDSFHRELESDCPRLSEDFANCRICRWPHGGRI
jgi:hypothetical protein